MELTIENIDEDSYAVGYKCWHINDTFSYSTESTVYSLNVSDSFTGCGLVIMHGWSIGNLNRPFQVEENEITADEINIKDFVGSVINDIKDRNIEEYSGIGAIQCTVGKDFYNGCFENVIKELGFKCILEFSNYRHAEDGSYTQRIYTLEL